ncbi:MAG: STAS/SEC14 domain-containing protein [Bacteroidetes bacterium]|nr:STAS/SEC14 domain-containing protein [Bacteroidota bacterium]
MEKSTQTTIEKRPESMGDFIAYNIKGKVTVEDIKEAHDNLLELLDRYKKLKLLVNIENTEGIEPEAVIKDLKFTLHYLDDFSGMAVVGDEKWQHILTEFSDKLVDFHIEYFESSKLNQAIKWIKNY